MIYVMQNPIEIKDLFEKYQEGSISRICLDILNENTNIINYNSIKELEFDLEYRESIVNSALELNRSDLRFAVFRKTEVNPEYFERLKNGGYKKLKNVSSYDAINDIYKNGKLYSTECATAMVIIYYKALADLFGKEKFDDNFKDIYLMNWHIKEPLLKKVGRMEETKVYLPGDRRYFDNPDVDPKVAHWQGENVIDLYNDKYYGHGIGIATGKKIIQYLNQNRIDNPTKEAYLMETVGKPDFTLLSKL